MVMMVMMMMVRLRMMMVMTPTQMLALRNPSPLLQDRDCKHRSSSPPNQCARPALLPPHAPPDSDHNSHHYAKQASPSFWDAGVVVVGFDWKVVLRRTRDIDMADLGGFCSVATPAANPAPALNALQIVVSQRPSEEMVTSARGFYLEQGATDLGGGVVGSALPIELCSIVSGQVYKRKLDGNQTSSMLKFATELPGRWSDMNAAVKKVSYDASGDGSLRDFSVRINTRAVTVQGRVLPVPRINYSASSTDQQAVEKRGWNLVRQKVTKGMTVKYWSIVNFSRLPQQDVERFVGKMIDGFANMGICIENNHPVIRNHNPPAREEMTKLIQAQRFCANSLAELAYPNTDWILAMGCFRYIGNVVAKINMKLG
ncbi:hypothetical protein BDK51DRAFT_28341, partial [Blyttiomyces helicus]